ncbi:MAG: lysine--tRNA ligase [Chloroflexota bacterium]
MTDLGDNLRQQRVKKLEELQQAGIDAYPPRFKRTHEITQVLDQFDALQAQDVTVAGRLVSVRAMGKATFAHIMDGSGRIQVYLRQDVLGEDQYSLFRLFDIGDFIGVTGSPFRTRTGEATIEVKRFVMLAKALRPLPEKWHGLTDVEKRYRQRYLDLITSPSVRDVFRLRSAIIAAIREFLDARGYIEVETPILQPIYGGAAAKPFTTYYNVLERQMFLRIATELYLKRLIIGGLDKVYEIGKNFRNEGLSTKHNPEFTVMESYEAYADYNDIMVLVEEMVAFVARKTLATMEIEYQGQRIDLTPPWRRITLRQSIIEYAGIDFEEHPDQASLCRRMSEAGIEVDPTLTWGKLIDELFSTFVQPQLVQPTFVVDYPVEISPLAKRKPGNPRLVERFEGFIGGLEMANAFTELNDPLDQYERFRMQVAEREAGDEEAQPMDEDYLVALEHGMPPTGGLGIGIDRLVMLLTNQASIREVILFPQLRARD